MLESIRKRRNSMIILGAFAAIIIVFIFWGVGPTGDNAGQTVVATVNGESIQVRDYVNLYKREVQYFKENLKGQFTDETAEKMNLKQRSLDILINRSLAEQAADDEGIKVTTEEVQAAIRAIPQFSRNGAFDKDVYFKVLSSNRVKPGEFEKSIEADLLTSKVRDKVVKDVTVTDEDVKQAYLKDNRKQNLEYIALDGSKFSAGVKVTDEEAKEFLKNNGSVFMEPARVKAFYAYADFATISKKIKFTQEELKDYYDKNPKEFEIPPAVKARHILIRPDTGAADKEKAKEEAKKKAEDVLKKVKAGGNFAALAKEFSQDPGSSKQGGDLGWFQKGVMVKSFEEAALMLKKNEVSPLIETEFGYHIILVEDKKEAGKVPLKDSEAAIKKNLAQYKVKNTAKEALMALSTAFKTANTVDELKKASASQKDVKTVETPLFTAEDKNVELVRNEMLRDVVFSMKGGESSGMIDTPEGIYLIKVVERQDARVPDYGKVADKVKKVVAAKKANDEAVKKADEIHKKAKSGEDISAIAKAEKLKVEETGFFSRVDGFMPKVGLYVIDKEKLFELNKTAAVYDEVVNHNGKLYVFRLKDSKEADEAGLEPKRELIKQRLLAEKQEKAVETWIKGLREKAKIKVFTELM